MNILETFYILFKSDASAAKQDNEGLEHSAEKAAAATEAAALTHEQALAAARMHYAVANRMAIENATVENLSAKRAAAAALELAAARVAEGKATHAATEELKRQGDAYAWNRSQRMELMGLARHSFDQLAAGGSVMRVAAMHAGTLAEALGSGPGGVAAGLEALAASAGKFILRWGVPLAILGSVVGLIGSAKSVADELEKDRLMSERVGMDISDLDALRKTIVKLGGDTKETDKDLERFANRLDDAFGNEVAKKPDRVAKALASIGVSVKDQHGNLKDTKTALLDVAGAFEHVSEARRRAVLRDLGFSSPRHGQTDPAMVKLLTGGREALERYLETEKRHGVETKEQAELAKKYKIEVAELADGLRDMRRVIAITVLPILTELVHAWRTSMEWLQDNKTLVQGFGIAFVAMAVAVSAATWGTLIPAFSAAAVALLAATWPFVLIGAAIASLIAIFAAVYEDITFFLKGQPSYLGELVAKYGWVRDAVKAVGHAISEAGRVAKTSWKGAGGAVDGVAGFFRGLVNTIGPIFRLIADLGRMIWTALGPAVMAGIRGEWGALTGTTRIFANVLHGVIGLVMTFARIFRSGIDGIAHHWHNNFTAMIAIVYRLIEAVRTLFGMKPDATVENFLKGVGAGRSQLAFAGAAPFAALTSPRLGMPGDVRPGGKSFSVSIGKVEVQTKATDADGIGKGIADALQYHTKAAAAAFDDGLDR